MYIKSRFYTWKLISIAHIWSVWHICHDACAETEQTTHTRFKRRYGNALLRPPTHTHTHTNAHTRARRRTAAAAIHGGDDGAGECDKLFEMHLRNTITREVERQHPNHHCAEARSRHVTREGGVRIAHLCRRRAVVEGVGIRGGGSHPAQGH